MVSARRIIWVSLIYALPIVLLTVLAGRFFCGWICPLGTALDATDTLFFRKRKKHEQTATRRNIKYYLLAGILMAALVSAQFAYLFDPITIITRAFTFAVFPLAQLASKGLVQSQYIPSDVQYFFRLNFLAAVLFIAILAANSVYRRYWCRNLCPMGALLGVLSKVSLVRRHVKINCAHCGKCTPDCKMGAILEDPTRYQATECVYCYSCTSVCPTLSTRIAPSVSGEGYFSKVDLNRRRVFQAIGVGALAAVLGQTNVAAKSDRTGRTRLSSQFLIRPPGALQEDEFVDRCVRCSECMKVCPTNGLQPALTEAGIEGLWTPVLIPRIGECTQNCNLCSQVCSTQAISPFEIAEKTHIYIGRAVIDRSHCIAWNSDKQCLVCDECCSYHAVGWKNVDGVRRPFIDEHKCVGCGICENVCPIQPVAAIRVFSFGDQRAISRRRQKHFFQQH
jgi:polyferredoxin